MEIRKEAELYYLNLFKDEYPMRPILEGLEFDRISNQETIWIERPFSKVEVNNTIKGMKGDKSLSPDGFSISFFQRYKDIVKELYHIYQCFQITLNIVSIYTHIYQHHQHWNCENR